MLYRLMLVTDRRLSPRPLIETVRLALEGGVDAVQLRERDMAPRGLLDLACELRRVTDDAGAALIVNHRLDIALAAEADGVQLGWRSLPVEEVHRLAGRGLRVGVSCHNAEQLAAALESGADYAVVGPVFATPSKEGLVDPLGLLILKQLVSQAKRLPLVAIGGIKPENVAQVRATGVTGVAVISAIVAAADPAASARLLAAN